MGKSGSRGGGSAIVVGVVVVLAVLGVGGYFFYRWFAHEWLDKMPMPVPTAQSTMLTKVKDDPALHKKVNKYLMQSGLVCSFEVRKPTSKSIYMTMHVASKDDEKTTYALVYGLASVYLYLTETHADPKTMVTVTITDGNLRAFDLSSVGWKAQMTFKEIKAALDEYHKQHPSW